MNINAMNADRLISMELRLELGFRIISESELRSESRVGVKGKGEGEGEGHAGRWLSGPIIYLRVSQSLYLGFGSQPETGFVIKVRVSVKVRLRLRLMIGLRARAHTHGGYLYIYLYIVVRQGVRKRAWRVSRTGVGLGLG